MIKFFKSLFKEEPQKDLMFQSRMRLEKPYNVDFSQCRWCEADRKLSKRCKAFLSGIIPIDFSDYIVIVRKRISFKGTLALQDTSFISRFRYVCYRNPLFNSIYSELDKCWKGLDEIDPDDEDSISNLKEKTTYLNLQLYEYFHTNDNDVFCVTEADAPGVKKWT